MVEASVQRQCEECGEPIGRRRLAALPTTTVCIECAEEMEAEGRARAARGENSVHLDEHQQASVNQALRDLTES